jgi:hypothetical protein
VRDRLVPEGGLAMDDVMLAQKIAVETDEKGTLRRLCGVALRRDLPGF